MFYPVDSLKKGGRFYMCWVADSWPLRFATITHRQLWSQDLRKICDDLMEVIRNESGRPANRFSLRLSSQLMRGLVRLYQKKVNVFMSDLSMINANVTKYSNQKYNIRGEVQLRTPRPRPHVTGQLTVQAQSVFQLEEPEIEQPIEVLIQNSGNVVANIQDITLREAAIPGFQLPPNDNFGEENPEQAILLVTDRTMEQMMAPGEPSSRVSVPELGLDSTDKSQVSRLAHIHTHEKLDEHDVTMFKSRVEELGGEYEKEIQIPDISEIPIPEIPIPPQEQVPLEPEIVEARQELTVPRVPVNENIELEDLEEPQAKRRRLRKLIIDRKTKLDSNSLRIRIENPNVELRCEDSFEDIVDISVPIAELMRRPSHAGSGLVSNLGMEITRLFVRNQGIVHRSPRAEMEFQNIQEDIMQRPRRFRTRSALLGRIDEVPEETASDKLIQDIPQTEAPSAENVTLPPISLPEITITATIVTDPQVDVQREVDIADMVTQKIATLSPEAVKRKSDVGAVLTPKIPRVGNASFRESQQRRQTAMASPQQSIVGKTLHPMNDKENIPENMQQIPEVQETVGTCKVTSMLQLAGLADIPALEASKSALEAPGTSQRPSRKRGSNASETPLGSLDRTKVSLGESEETTDSRRFIRDEWGTEGTMLKVLSFVRAKSKPITVGTLVAKGPVISGYTNIIAARCFTSLLKLKQHDFVSIEKYPDTLEIKDVDLGRKFD